MTLRVGSSDDTGKGTPACPSTTNEQVASTPIPLTLAGSTPAAATAALTA